MKITATLACLLAIAGTLTLSAPTEARLSANRIAANKLATNKLATNKLATNKLAANSVALRQPPSPRVAGDGAFSGVKEIALPNGIRLVR